MSNGLFELSYSKSIYYWIQNCLSDVWNSTINTRKTLLIVLININFNINFKKTYYKINFICKRFIKKLTESYNSYRPKPFFLTMGIKIKLQKSNCFVFFVEVNTISIWKASSLIKAIKFTKFRQLLFQDFYRIFTTIFLDLKNTNL